ncbi:hypothetical protein JK635_03540 [Neobacillus sp. YIM B02564]|uniref:Uncharacterized protein n=1 Tax=Neobacillus paridis TaxID=2803862 RepID=A0ABS1TKM0_9BACI|nr:hypothetical protein [Neobacillus paridis]MBL4951314.1 hypothetical protein [Neobacillus paridis]
MNYQTFVEKKQEMEEALAAKNRELNELQSVIVEDTNDMMKSAFDEVNFAKKQAKVESKKSKIEALKQLIPLMKSQIEKFIADNREVIRNHEAEVLKRKQAEYDEKVKSVIAKRNAYLKEVHELSKLRDGRINQKSIYKAGENEIGVTQELLLLVYGKTMIHSAGTLPSWIENE